MIYEGQVSQATASDNNHVAMEVVSESELSVECQ